MKWDGARVNVIMVSRHSLYRLALSLHHWLIIEFINLCVCPSTYDKWPKTTCKRKGFISSYNILLYHWRKSRNSTQILQGSLLDAGADEEAMEECFLLACCSWLPQPSYLYKPGPSTQGVTTYGRLDPYIIRKCLQIFPIGQSVTIISQLRAPLPR